MDPTEKANSLKMFILAFWSIDLKRIRNRTLPESWVRIRLFPKSGSPESDPELALVISILLYVYEQMFWSTLIYSFSQASNWKSLRTKNPKPPIVLRLDGTALRVTRIRSGTNPVFSNNFKLDYCYRCNQMP